jgi:hypothetical protein
MAKRCQRIRTSFKLAAYAQAACSSHEPQPLTTLDSALQISKLIRQTVSHVAFGGVVLRSFG